MNGCLRQLLTRFPDSDAEAASQSTLSAKHVGANHLPLQPGFSVFSFFPDGSSMRAVLATTVVWILARFAFWIGYHRSAAMRGLGAPGMALSLIVLLDVAGRIGYELGGFVGAAVPVVAFLANRGLFVPGDTAHAIRRSFSSLPPRCENQADCRENYMP